MLLFYTCFPIYFMGYFVGKTIYGMKISFLVSFTYAYEDDGIVQEIFFWVFRILTPQLLFYMENTAATQPPLDEGWNRWLVILHCLHIKAAPWLGLSTFFFFLY